MLLLELKWWFAHPCAGGRWREMSPKIIIHQCNCNPRSSRFRGCRHMVFNPSVGGNRMKSYRNPRFKNDFNLKRKREEISETSNE